VVHSTTKEKFAVETFTDLVDGDEITICLDKQDSPCQDLPPTNEVQDRELAFIFPKRIYNNTKGNNGRHEFCRK